MVVVWRFRKADVRVLRRLQDRQEDSSATCIPCMSVEVLRRDFCGSSADQ
jgi:hypothetical protein